MAGQTGEKAFLGNCTHQSDGSGPVAPGGTQNTGLACHTQCCPTDMYRECVGPTALKRHFRLRSLTGLFQLLGVLEPQLQLILFIPFYFSL